MYSVNELAELIYKKTLTGELFGMHKNIVVVGNNSSGKTTLIKQILTKAHKDKSNDIYFIDALNRVVVDQRDNETDERFCSHDIFEVLETRIDNSNFSKNDYFVDDIRGGAVAFAELTDGGKTQFYEDLFNYFFQCKIEIIDVPGATKMSGKQTVKINDTLITDLSSSEAAKIRLLMEIAYASGKKAKLIVVDEFDDHFDSDNLLDFMMKLMSYFDECRFCFVIHNFEILVQLSNTDIVVYNDTIDKDVEIRLLDVDDITERGQISKMRRKYIGEQNEEEIRLSECISDYIKKGKVSNESKLYFVELNRESLNAKEKVMYDYVLERIENEG